jgi:phage shock protein PspC (stress-responsive transcriptional regulator)
LLHSKGGFSEYWNWDYRWGLRIVAIVIGVAAALTAFAVTRSARSGGA